MSELELALRRFHLVKIQTKSLHGENSCFYTFAFTGKAKPLSKQLKLRRLTILIVYKDVE